MAEEFKAGCQRPAIKKPVVAPAETEIAIVKEEKQSMIKVGKPAPDFTAPAFFEGKFSNVNLSDY